MKLYNGIEIPDMGFGTWLVENKVAKDIVLDAINVGYRHIDSAQGYGNEEGVGKAILASGIKREDLFITSKVEAYIKSYTEAKKSILESLKKLNTSYIDLMLIHAPKPWDEMETDSYRYEKENLEVWKALEEAYEDGKIKAIGVSNFIESDIENIIKNAKIKPMVNQIQVNFFCKPISVIEYCKKNDIVVEAYSPNAHGTAFGNIKVKEYANKYNVSEANFLISFTRSLGLVTLPKASQHNHILENFNANTKILDEDIKDILNMK